MFKPYAFHELHPIKGVFCALTPKVIEKIRSITIIFFIGAKITKKKKVVVLITLDFRKIKQRNNFSKSRKNLKVVEYLNYYFIIYF